MTKKHNHENVENQAEALSKAESFLINNQKNIITAVVVVLAVGIGAFVWSQAKQSKLETIKESYFQAETLSMEAMDSLSHSQALEAIKAVFEAYGENNTRKAVAIAPFQAGIHAYELGLYTEAIAYFESYEGEDAIFNARALACIGDCYVNLEDYAKAIEYYSQAVACADNRLASEYAFKAGLTAEKMGNKEQALEFYNIVKDQYTNSPRGAEIDKYISRIEAK